MLYSVELRSHSFELRVQRYALFLNLKTIQVFFFEFLFIFFHFYSFNAELRRTGCSFSITATSCLLAPAVCTCRSCSLSFPERHHRTHMLHPPLRVRAHVPYYIYYAYIVCSLIRVHSPHSCSPSHVLSHSITPHSLPFLRPLYALEQFSRKISRFSHVLYVFLRMFAVRPLKKSKNLSLFSWAVKYWALRGSLSFTSLCRHILLYFFTKTFGYIARSSYFCTRKWGQGRMSERKRSVLWNTYITFSREVQDQENRPHCLVI